MRRRGGMRRPRRYEEAEATYVEALEMRRRALPGGHPKLALPLWNPSMTYKRAEQYEKAPRMVGEGHAI